MRVFTCTDHDNHWVGVASVVVAEDEDAARIMLAAEIATHGLDGSKPFTLQELDTNFPHAMILQDGDY